MRVATASPDANGGATLFIRIPEALNESERQYKYDLPLTKSLAAQNIAYFLRGFTLPAKDDGSHGVSIEVQAESVETLASVAQLVADLGAPSDTVIEIETDKGAIELSLAEASDWKNHS